MASIALPDAAARNVLDRQHGGNARVVSTGRGSDIRLNPTRRAELAAGQYAFYVILACADSRVPSETVFALGPGGQNASCNPL